MPENNNSSPEWGIELTPNAPPDRVATLGRAAETSGFDTAFVSCHYNNRDPFITLDRLANATEGIRIGPGVANPYDIHPVRIASQVATLAEVSDGRAVLGLGAGDPSTLQNLGLEWGRPLTRVRETIRVHRRLWAGERVDHDGTFRVQDAGLNYEAQQVPIFVGGQGPKMIQMAAEHADGVLVNASHPDDYAWAAEQVEIGLDARAESRGPFTFAAFASVSVDTDAAAARNAARKPVAFIAAGAPDEVIERHELDAGRTAEIGAAISAGEFDRAYELVTAGMLDAFCVAGAPSAVADQIASIREYTDAFVAASPLGPDRREAIELLGSVRDQLATQGSTDD
ncbi:5,10-methylenetetrahydromethanopterin reductase [Halobellus sp. GM3]|uniref:5,10-methylenetetrahydromethanopterin reductase n=1 Tax=Halobellus sp. GM3 TaxID=3458410 RepID=UPI00403D7E5B